MNINMYLLIVLSGDREVVRHTHLQLDHMCAAIKAAIPKPLEQLY